MTVRRAYRQLAVLLALAAAAAPLAAQDETGERPGPSEVDGVDPAVDFSRAPEPARPALPGTSGAVDTLDLGTTSITGNQELPRVLYIVPWKPSDLGDLVGRPVDTLLDEVLAPIDPEVFERHVSYYETLHGDTQED